MALGIGQLASAVPATVARGMSMDRDGFPGAVHSYGARRVAPRIGSALQHRGRWDSPTRERLARPVPDRSLLRADAARAVINRGGSGIAPGSECRRHEHAGHVETGLTVCITWPVGVGIIATPRSGGGCRARRFIEDVGHRRARSAWRGTCPRVARSTARDQARRTGASGTERAEAREGRRV